MGSIGSKASLPKTYEQCVLRQVMTSNPGRSSTVRQRLRNVAFAPAQLRGVDSPAYDPSGVDANNRAAQGCCGVRRIIKRITPAADLDASNPPWLERGDVVDDQCDSAIVSSVPEFLAGLHTVPADVD